MDEKLRNMIQENNTLLREAVENTQDTNTRIKKIHGIMKRTFWSRIVYWVLLLLITAGAFYAIVPSINNFINKYTFIDANVNSLGERDSSDAEKFLDYFFSSDEEERESESSAS